MPRITTAQLTAQRRGRPLPRPEREVQGAVLAYLRTVPGVFAQRMNSRVVMMPGRGGRMRPVRFGFKGCSDIIGWRASPILANVGGRMRPITATFLAIECKREGEEPDDDQRAFLQAVRDAGGIAIVATCVEDVRTVLHP